MQDEWNEARDDAIPGDINRTICAREPIHIPDLIQPHGFLLVFDLNRLIVTRVSENTVELIKITPSDLLGSSLENLLGFEQCARLKAVLRGDDLVRANPLKMRIPDNRGGQWFNVLIHTVQADLVLEAECLEEDCVDRFQDFYVDVRNATARVQATDSEEALGVVAVNEIRRIIGYDRAMLYRFDTDWSGHVVAESKADDVTTSYLDLHFPSSDIPAQARRLYTINRVRCIPNVKYRPVGLLSDQEKDRQLPLDMSHCSLRSVSPIHLEYLQNIGVQATVTISLLKDGELVGLIACHNYTPKFVSAEQRLTCSFLSQIIESQLNIRQEGLARAARMQTAATHMHLLELFCSTSSLGGLSADPQSFLALADAQGGVIIEGDKYILMGITPDDKEIASLVEVIKKSEQSSVLAADCLVSIYPEAETYKDKACGLLGVELSCERREYLLWFRQELTRTIDWAGNPDKAAGLDSVTGRIHPRKSFDLWQESIKLRSAAWKPAQISGVVELKKILSFVQSGEQQVRTHSLQQKALSELSSLSLSSIDTYELFQKTAQIIINTFGVEICRIYEKPFDCKYPLIAAGISPKSAVREVIAVEEQLDHFAASVISSGLSLLVNDIESDARFNGKGISDFSGVASGIAVPFPLNTLMQGAITVYSYQSHKFNKEDLRFVENMALILGSAIRTKQIEKDYQHRLQHDSLTGLPNRTLFMSRLAQALLNPLFKAAVLLIDLDRFKEVNDILGHKFGDLLLQQAAIRFRKVLRTSDTLARFGGDEFVVMLENADEAHVVSVADRIIAELKQPFLINTSICNVGASIGLAIFPQHGNGPDSLVQRAEVAMYTAKRLGGGLEIYSADNDEYNTARLELLSDLQNATQSGSLVLHYQPKMNLKTRRCDAAEALARWFHPVHGTISPSCFIPMAEHIGLAGELGIWGITQAFTQYKDWKRKNLDLSIAVNLSPRLLHDAALHIAIADIYSQTQMPLNWLTLEITEGTLMQDPKAAAEILAMLRGEFGLKISVDDFGVGYSSLAYLRRLPIDEIKIDKEFITHMAVSDEDAAIVKTVIDLGHSLNLSVVGEGIEDLDTLNLLTSLGCDYAQGFCISRAISPTDLFSFLTSAKQTFPE
jgi:diguanylate cyclase (GGDEF)-like protein